MSKNKKLLTKGRNIFLALSLALGAIASPLLSGHASAAGERLYYQTGIAGTITEGKGLVDYSRASTDSHIVKNLEDVYVASDSTEAKGIIDSIKNQGYVFTGWKTKTRQEDKVPGEDISTYYYSGMIKSSVTLIAQWAPKATVNLNGAAVTSADTITFRDGDETAGTVVFDKYPAVQGNSLKVTVTPSENYIVKTFKVNDEDKTLDGNEYNIVSAGAVVNYTVEFVRTYDITASVAGGNGSVSPLGETVNKGDSFDLTISPDTGWHLSRLTINGDVANFSGSVYHVESVEEDMEFEATFERDIHTVSVYADAGATVTPMNPEVYYGDDQVFSISIEKGYELIAVALDGTQVDEGIEGEDGEYTYTLENVTEDAELGVYAVADEYEVVEGDGQEIDYEADGANLTFRFDGDLDLFRAFFIDGEEVSVENYDTESGSTIITVHYDYLPTIGNGEHVAKALYANGNYAEAFFMLKNLPEVPDTGSQMVTLESTKSNVIIFASIAGLMAALGMFITLRKHSNR